jgi:ABC-type multidrug transport system permease subunit
MNRLLLALKNEIKFVRTSIPVHLVAMLQPTVMYLLMSVILVHPTFDMYVTPPSTEDGRALVDAMQGVASPIGVPYINPVLIEMDKPDGLRQVVTVEERSGRAIVTQHYGLIDSNMVKNFRNRLTAAALRLWNDELGRRAILIEERPWLPKDVSYTLYFGMAMLPLTIAVAASIVGGILTAQEFEYGTILEYRLAPVSSGLVIGSRLIRLIIIGLISAVILLITLWLVNGVWPASLWRVGLILVPIGIIAGSLGITVGLLARKSIPAFLVGLVTSFVGWLIGSAFGLAAGFNRVYEFISRLTPNTHAVELLYPLYFGTGVGKPWYSIAYLTVVSSIMVMITVLVYRQRVIKQV